MTTTFDTEPCEPVQFDELADRLVEVGGNGHPSEIHGYLCGLLSAGSRPAVQDWLKQVSEQLGDASFDDVTEALLSQLFRYTLGTLESGSFSASLLLPDDEDGLRERTESLGVWCQSFVSGFGQGLQNQEVGEMVEEVLRDFAQISLIEATEDSEESEKLFVEVSEFVRLAWLNVFAEVCTKSASSTGTNEGADKARTPDTLH